MAAVQKPQVEGFSGTVVSHLSLGLPDLPSLGSTGGAGTTFSSLLSGSHTMQVWYGGVDRQRVALLGATDETDVFRDGTDFWQWSSADHRALHAVLPDQASGGPAALSRATPLDLAQRVLRAVEPSTRVQVEKDRSVADRSAYDLVLIPRTSETKVGEVRIAVDGQTKVPLGVQILARGSSTPSVDVSFTTIVFGPQAERRFRFSPPAGAHVSELARPSARAAGDEPARTTPTVTTTGSGWQTVTTVRPGKKQLAALHDRSVLSALKPVSGNWGSGHLLDSNLVSALITADGRVLVGAVSPAGLYAAAGRK
jgi:outer membrane lipoprotein-sorting protein